MKTTIQTFTLQQSVLPLSIIFAMSLTACGLQQTRDQQVDEKQEQKQEQNLISKVTQPNTEQNKEVTTESVNPEMANKETVNKTEKTIAIKDKGIKAVEAKTETEEKVNLADKVNGIAKPTTQQRTATQDSDNSQVNAQINNQASQKQIQNHINNVVNVKVIPAKLVTVPQVKKYTGTTTAFETRQVPANANGTVGEIYFKQGNWIKAGAPLYRIDPIKGATKSINTIKATYKQAKADLESAKAAHKHAKALLKTNQSLLAHAQDDLDRYQRLIVDKAVSQQTYNQAFNEVKTAKNAIKSTKSLINQTAADIKKAKANVELAKSYMDDEQSQLKPQMVKAPLTGVVVESHIVKGQKVNRNQTDAFVTIATVNPIFVDVQPTTDEFLAIQKAIAQNKKKPKANKVKLILNNGKAYASSGAFKFTETTVDENKQVTMKALFDNPKGQLLPNMQVTVELPMPKLVDVVLIPPTAIQSSVLVNTADSGSNSVSNNSGSNNDTKAVNQANSNASKNSVNENAKSQSKTNANTKAEVKIKGKADNKAESKATSKVNAKVNAKVDTAKKQLEKPTSASIQKNNQQVKAIVNFVYVVDKDNRVQARNVTINADNNYHGKLIVEKGLKQGDKIIVDSDDVILPRQLVAIQAPEKNKTNEKTKAQETKEKATTVKDNKINASNKAVSNKIASTKETDKQASKQQVISESHQLTLYPWQLMEMVVVKQTVKEEGVKETVKQK